MFVCKSAVNVIFYIPLVESSGGDGGNKPITQVPYGSNHAAIS